MDIIEPGARCIPAASTQSRNAINQNRHMLIAVNSVDRGFRRPDVMVSIIGMFRTITAQLDTARDRTEDTP